MMEKYYRLSLNLVFCLLMAPWTFSLPQTSEPRSKLAVAAILATTKGGSSNTGSNTSVIIIATVTPTALLLIGILVYLLVRRYRKKLLLKLEEENKLKKKVRSAVGFKLDPAIEEKKQYRAKKASREKLAQQKKDEDKPFDLDEFYGSGSVGANGEKQTKIKIMDEVKKVVYKPFEDDDVHTAEGDGSNAIDNNNEEKGKEKIDGETELKGGLEEGSTGVLGNDESESVGAGDSEADLPKKKLPKDGPIMRVKSEDLSSAAGSVEGGLQVTDSQDFRDIKTTKKSPKKSALKSSSSSRKSSRDGDSRDKLGSIGLYGDGNGNESLGEEDPSSTKKDEMVIRAKSEEFSSSNPGSVDDHLRMAANSQEFHKPERRSSLRSSVTDDDGQGIGDASLNGSEYEGSESGKATDEKSSTKRNNDLVIKVKSENEPSSDTGSVDANLNTATADSQEFRKTKHSPKLPKKSALKSSSRKDNSDNRSEDGAGSMSKIDKKGKKQPQGTPKTARKEKTANDETKNSSLSTKDRSESRHSSAEDSSFHSDAPMIKPDTKK